MNLDDKICYCFDVSMRKLVNYARRVKPEPCSRMTECLGAGTGCGWCIPFLIKIAHDPEAFLIEDITEDQYATLRKTYIKTEPKNTFDKDAAEKESLDKDAFDRDG